jgi:hypothetical protein
MSIQRERERERESKFRAKLQQFNKFFKNPLFYDKFPFTVSYRKNLCLLEIPA